MDALSAISAILGSVVAAVLAIAGFLVRSSLEERNANLKEQEEKRLALDRQSAQEAEERAEDRLRLDSAVQALQLVKSAREDEAPEQAAGALFALVNLEQIDFALALLGEMWASGLVSGSAAKWVLDQVFSKDVQAQHAQAARIIERHPTAFAEGHQLYLPEVVYGAWPEEMDNYTKYILLLAIARSVHLVPREDSSDLQAALITGILAMREPSLGVADPKPHDAALLVSVVGSCLYGRRPTIFGIRDGEQFHWESVFKEAQELMSGTTGTLQMQTAMELYANWGQE